MFALVMRVAGRILGKVPPTAMVKAGIAYYLWRKLVDTLKKGGYQVVGSLAIYGLYRYAKYRRSRRQDQ